MTDRTLPYDTYDTDTFAGADVNADWLPVDVQTSCHSNRPDAHADLNAERNSDADTDENKYADASMEWTSMGAPVGFNLQLLGCLTG